MSGSVLAQVINVVASPILTRIYSPDQFGVFSVFLSAITMFTVITTMRYDHAIVLPRKDEEAVEVVRLCLLVGMGAGGLYLLGISFNNGGPVWLYTLVLPVAVFLRGLTEVFNYWNVRTKDFKFLAANRVGQAGASTTTQVLMGWSGLGYLGLVLGQFFGSIVGNISLVRRYLASRRCEPRRKFSWLALRVQVVRYRNFPLYTSWADLLKAISFGIPVFLLGGIFDAEVAGYYSLAYRVLLVPTGLSDGSIVSRNV